MTKVLQNQLIDTKKATNVVITLLIIIGACLVPTFLAKIVPLGKYQQVVIGTIVNASLICVALYTKGNAKTIAMATLPSVSTILGGILFGGITMYSKLMIPAIWLGNFLMIFLYKFLFVSKNRNYLISSLIAIITKVTVIYSGFYIMSINVDIPAIAKNTLNTSMGITQMITASLGAMLMFFLMKIINKNKRHEIEK